MNNRATKIASIIQKELGELFIKMDKGDLHNVFISVMEVQLTADLSIAKAYISVFPTDKREETLNFVNANIKPIRFHLGKQLKHMRKLPEIRFTIDNSLDHAERIDELLKK